MALTRDQILLEEIFANSPAFIAVLHGPDFIFEKVNKKYYEIVGHRELLGKKLTEAIPEIKDQPFPDILARVLESGLPFRADEIPAEIQRTPGGPIETRYVDLVYQRILDHDGKPNNILAHGVDVTDKVIARMKQEEADRLFRTFADAMPHMAFIADPEGNITFFNKRWYEYVNGMEGTEGWGWKEKPIHHPDDLERTVERWTHSLKTGEPYEIEYRLRRHDGVYRWHAGRAVPNKNDKGEIVSWIGTNTDIHDYMSALEKLSESESKFKTITDAMPQMVWSTLPDGHHDYYNDRWYEFTGVPYGSTDGEGWNGMFHSEDQEKAWKIWRHSLETGEPYMIEYRLRYKDGTYRWVLGRALPIRNQKGEIVRWMGTCTDIHEIKEHEKVLKNTQQELQVSLQARDEFLSIASHELRTPLTALKLQSQSLSRKLEKGASQEISMDRLKTMVQITERQINKLTRLVDDMLDLSRIQSGKLSFKKEKTDLSSLLIEVIERMEDQILLHGCQFNYEVPPGYTAMVDRFRIEQVIINLLTNAMKYGNKSPISIQLKEKEDYFLLSVRDQGLGIAPENQEKIFNRFERAVNANEISGLGLGLYITRQIVEGHGGKIWVESNIGNGSIFYVEIPKL